MSKRGRSRVRIARLGAPGEPATVDIRSFLGGQWQHYHTTWLNLLDHPGVGGVLCIVEHADGPVIVPAFDETRGSHEVTDWMVMALDDHGAIVSVEGATVDLLGYTSDGLTGRPPTEFMAPEAHVVVARLASVLRRADLAMFDQKRGRKQVRR